MKKILFFLFFLIGNLNAQIIRITANDNLQTAINNASDGTVFLVEGGSYGTLNISKRVTLIGTGYFLINSQPLAILYDVNFDAGSDGSIITGFRVSRYITVSNASNFSIQRNYVKNISISEVSSPITNIEIKQNFIEDYIALNCHNYSFKNNICLRANLISCIIGDCNGQIVNNIFNLSGDPNTSYGVRLGSYTNTIKNNIFLNIVNLTGDSGYPINVENYPLFRFNVYGTMQGTPNITNTRLVDFSNVFQGYPTNPLGLLPDVAAQLTNSSSAKGVGDGNIDCGVFDGDSPYILSGMPIGPHIYQLQSITNAAPGQTIQVHIKAKVQN